MGKENSKVQVQVEALFVAALDAMKKDETAMPTSQLLVQIDPAEGEIQIYSDKETLLEKKVIFEWVNTRQDGKGLEAQEQRIVATLRNAISALVADNVFDNELINKPLVVSQTDEVFQTVRKIYTVEDKNNTADENLLKFFKTETDNFYRKLLADME